MGIWIENWKQLSNICNLIHLFLLRRRPFSIGCFLSPRTKIHPPLYLRLHLHPHPPLPLHPPLHRHPHPHPHPTRLPMPRRRTTCSRPTCWRRAPHANAHRSPQCSGWPQRCGRKDEVIEFCLPIWHSSSSGIPFACVALSFLSHHILCLVVLSMFSHFLCFDPTHSCVHLSVCSQFNIHLCRIPFSQIRSLPALHRWLHSHHGLHGTAHAVNSLGGRTGSAGSASSAGGSASTTASGGGDAKVQRRERSDNRQLRASYGA